MTVKQLGSWHQLIAEAPSEVVNTLIGRVDEYLDVLSKLDMDKYMNNKDKINEYAEWLGSLIATVIKMNALLTVQENNE